MIDMLITEPSGVWCGWAVAELIVVLSSENKNKELSSRKADDRCGYEAKLRIQRMSHFPSTLAGIKLDFVQF